MYKQKIEYVDFNDNKRVEEFYFHLTVVEATRIEARIAEETGDNTYTIKDYIEKLIVDNKTKQVLDFLEEMILTSYGEKSTDGRSFVKNKEIKEAFEYSQAYAELFEQLLTKEGLAQEFGEAIADNGQDKKKKNQPNLKVTGEDNSPEKE